MQETLARWLSDPILGKLAASAIAIVVVVVLVRITHRTLGRIVRDPDSRYRSRKFTTFLGYIAAILAIGAIFSNQFGTLTVAFGVAGAGIAFALQEVIASVAGWVAIVFGNFFKVGDRVLLGGIRGDVIDIGVLRTTLMECGDWVHGDLYNGRIVRIANSFVFKEPVFNYSADYPFLWDELVIPIRYGSERVLARSLIEDTVRDQVGDYAEYAKRSWGSLVQKYRIEDASVEPLVSMTANENWMDFTVRYVVDFKRRRTTKDKLFTAILDAFDRTDGKVELASTSIDVRMLS
jgi:small-conductance mechanosensitive channel